jgi:hypothetical protein
VPRVPSPDCRYYRPVRAVSCTASADITPPSSLLRTHAPDQSPPTDLGRPIIRWVFAGCRPSLLGDGPSRRYLYNPCVVAWTLTPPCSSGALARFFPRRLRLHVADRRFTHSSFPAMQLQQGVSFEAAVIRLTFRLLRLLDSLVAPTFIIEVEKPFTPRRTWLVTCPKQWHRYACIRAIHATGLAPDGL